MPEFDATLEYRDIEGFPGYKVGNDGTVWSCWVIGPRGKGRGKGAARVMNPLIWKELKACPRPNGYLAVPLYAEGKMKFVSVHRLVLTSFRAPRSAKQQCRHLNGIQTDNRLCNLVWGTAKENHDDKKLHGTTSRGEKHGNATLTENLVREIRKLRTEGWIYKDIAERLDLRLSTVAKVATYQTWAHVKTQSDPTS